MTKYAYTSLMMAIGDEHPCLATVVFLTRYPLMTFDDNLYLVMTRDSKFPYQFLNDLVLYKFDDLFSFLYRF